MQPPAKPSAEKRGSTGAGEGPRAASETASGWRTLGRHQAGAVAATLVDFATMIACVEGLAWSAVRATATGASLGAVTSFSLGRTWVFRRKTGHWAGQAARYGLVSAASASWNTLGEHVLHDMARVQYVVARVFVALAVSVLWNFPMQRRFVFREGSHARGGGAPRDQRG